VTSLMRPLFAFWDELAPRLASSRTIALFLDFDGTLVDIRPRPDMVRVHPAARRTLASLARSPRFRVWVISARRRADIRARLRVPAVRYLGLYGWERGPSLPAPPSSPIFHVKSFLAGTLPAHPSIWLEDKEHTIAVHYRGAPEHVRRAALERVHRAVDAWRSRVRVAPGKCVWEIVPIDLNDKGAAVRRELAALPTRALPVYVGDDLSDESAFAALPHGVGIRVGGLRSTRARYRLDGAGDVRHFLEKLQAEFL
jgi:trehalose 6-phosphate phosphatase